MWRWKKNFSKLSVIKNKFWSTILEEKLKYLFVRSVKNITKSLLFWEVIKKYEAKKV